MLHCVIFWHRSNRHAGPIRSCRYCTRLRSWNKKQVLAARSAKFRYLSFVIAVLVMMWRRKGIVCLDLGVSEKLTWNASTGGINWLNSLILSAYDGRIKAIQFGIACIWLSWLWRQILVDSLCCLMGWIRSIRCFLRRASTKSNQPSYGPA